MTRLADDNEEVEFFLLVIIMSLVMRMMVVMFVVMMMVVMMKLMVVVVVMRRWMKTLVVIRSGSKIFKTFAPGAPLAFSGWVGIPRKFRKIKLVTRLHFWYDQKILCSCLM